MQIKVSFTQIRPPSMQMMLQMFWGLCSRQFTVFVCLFVGWLVGWSVGWFVCCCFGGLDLVHVFHIFWNSLHVQWQLFLLVFLFFHIIWITYWRHFTELFGVFIQGKFTFGEIWTLLHDDISHHFSGTLIQGSSHKPILEHLFKEFRILWTTYSRRLAYFGSVWRWLTIVPGSLFKAVSPPSPAHNR